MKKSERIIFSVVLLLIIGIVGINFYAQEYIFNTNLNLVPKGNLITGATVSISEEQVNTNQVEKTTNSLNLGGQALNSKTNNIYLNWFLVSLVTITILVWMGIYLHKKHLN
jgi:hypothetical protein